MTPLEAIEYSLTRELKDPGGKRFSLKVEPGLEDAEIDDLERTLPSPIPGDVRRLLRRTSGVYWSREQMDFTGREMDFGLEDVFPFPHPIAHDGFGNFWVVDLSPASTDWGPIYYACHDAPVILYQSPNLTEFLKDFTRSFVPPFESLVTGVRDDSLFNVWRTNPGVLSHRESLNSMDSELSAFASTLDEAWQFVDLRQAKPGQGFSWGRYGPQTEVKRYGFQPIFAYKEPPRRKGLLSFLRR